jgi:hypothetical protein
MSRNLTLFLVFLVGLLAGFGAGVGSVRLRSRTRATRPEDGGTIPPPLDQAEYDKRLKYSDRRYHDAMAQYDKLVPWAAGGGLVVSLTFVASFAGVAPAWTRFILAVAWVALVGALLCSILSQYSSTRIQVWGKSYLKSRQNPPPSTADAAAVNQWRSKALDFERRSNRSGHRTKLLNVWAAVLLVAGLVALGTFAIVAAPFGKAVPPQ